MKKFSIITAMSAALFLGCMMNLAAQGSIVIPAGDRIACVFECHGIVFVRDANGNVQEFPADAGGGAEFESQGDEQDLTDAGYNNSILAPVSINVSGAHPVYGTFSLDLDPSRPTPNSTVVANVAGQDFPATADVYANMTGTISGLSGTFINATPCHMRTTNLQSFNPQHGETYTFVNSVDFYDPDRPEEDGTRFTIPAGATVILH